MIEFDLSGAEDKENNQPKELREDKQLQEQQSMRPCEETTLPTKKRKREESNIPIMQTYKRRREEDKKEMRILKSEKQWQWEMEQMILPRAITRKEEALMPMQEEALQDPAGMQQQEEKQVTPQVLSEAQMITKEKQVPNRCKIFTNISAIARNIDEIRKNLI